MLTPAQRHVKLALTNACAAYPPGQSRIVSYYIERARQGAVLSPYDGGAILLLRHLAPSTLLEVGACAGQFGLMLAADGWDVTAIDPNREAVALGVRLAEAVHSSLSGRHRYLEGSFPAPVEAEVVSLLGCPIFGPTQEINTVVEQSFRASLCAAPYLMIDLRFYPQVSHDPVVWRERLGLFPGHEVIDGFGYMRETEGNSVFLLRRRERDGALSPDVSGAA